MNARAALGRTVLRVVIGFATACAAMLVLFTAHEMRWHLHPNLAFAHYTGTPLPPGIVALRYGWTINDNLFHAGHYWLLRGTPENIAAFAQAQDFGEASEEAYWNTPNAHELFGLTLPKERMRVGYRRHNGRTDWIWVYGDGLAIYDEQ